MRKILVSIFSAITAIPVIALSPGVANAAYSREFNAGNAYGDTQGSFTIVSKNYIALNHSTVRDFKANPSTTYVYVSWSDSNQSHNKQVASVSNGKSKNYATSVDLIPTAGWASDVLITVCSSAGGWHCGTPG